MSASTDCNTHRRNGGDFEFPVKAATKIYAGTIVAIDTASNLAVKGATAVGLKAVGVAQEQIDNTAGADGALRVKVKRGLFKLANSSAADLIVLGDIAGDCYMVDDQTVAKTNGGGTRSVAGKVRDVDSGGVWVEF